MTDRPEDRNNHLNFNSIKVRLEFDYLKGECTQQVYFNSIKVRLESDIALEGSDKFVIFQFHKGAIGVPLIE